MRRTPKPVNRIATPGRAETAPLPVKVMDEGAASAIGWDYVRSRPLKRLLRKLEPYCWVAPACGVLFVFTYLPILLEGGLSLLAADGFSAPRFIGYAVSAAVRDFDCFDGADRDCLFPFAASVHGRPDGRCHARMSL